LAGARRGRARRLAGGVRRNGDHAVTGPVRQPLSSADFVAWLSGEGEKRYHDHHPFHVRMHEGKLTREELQSWVQNRYYYQSRVPIKDAIILSKSEDPAFRRMWIQRIHDHDGDREEEGERALWLRLAAGVVVSRYESARFTQVRPGVRFACDAYAPLVQNAS